VIFVDWHARSARMIAPILFCAALAAAPVVAEACDMAAVDHELARTAEASPLAAASNDAADPSPNTGADPSPNTDEAAKPSSSGNAQPQSAEPGAKPATSGAPQTSGTQANEPQSGNAPEKR